MTDEHFVDDQENWFNTGKRIWEGLKYCSRNLSEKTKVVALVGLKVERLIETENFHQKMRF